MIAFKFGNHRLPNRWFWMGCIFLLALFCAVMLFPIRNASSEQGQTEKELAVFLNYNAAINDRAIKPEDTRMWSGEFIDLVERDGASIVCVNDGVYEIECETVTSAVALRIRINASRFSKYIKYL